jgi:Flp pilus assembly protein TadD
MIRSILPFLLAILLIWPASCAGPLPNGALSAGITAAGADDWEAAVRHWTEAVGRDPRSAAAHNNLAVAFERRGAWEDARREYEAAIRIDPASRTIKDNYASFKARMESGRGKRP